MEKTTNSRSGSALSRYLADIRRFRLLTKDEELAIGRSISSGMRESQNDLVLSNLGFVVKIASEYQNLGLPFEDLLNEGNMGLIHAASRYDHRKSIKFITYASWWVRKSILKALAEQSSMIRVPSYQRKKVARLRAQSEAVKSQHKHACSDRPCAICAQEVPQATRFRAVSLDDPMSADGHARLIEILVDFRSEDHEREIIKREDLAHLERSLSSLNEKERAVISRRFGLAGGRVFTLKEIGVTLGLSRERVRQIEMAARKKLRGHLHRAGVPPAPEGGRAGLRRMPSPRQKFASS
ncbi:MAG TPA: RNA polymerase sigma factor RpoD/SigA [Candidatus Polarisedimenticolia bacterium]|nr:RNA polymerase sigma factor RpoD/SigA [Candidatus Polarisedimenticolia bacterium]